MPPANALSRLRKWFGSSMHAVGARRHAALLLFLGPALAMSFVDAQLLLGGAIALLGTAVAAALGRPRFAEFRWGQLPAGIFAVIGPVFLAPGGLLEVLLAAASGFGILAWITMITNVPMGPGRRRAGLTVPLVGLLMSLAVAFATPGLSAGPAFTALLVVLAIFVVAIGLLGGPETGPAPIDGFDDPGGTPTP
jgi:hypothetical protein